MAVTLASAFAQAPARISKPGQYQGYSTASYDGVERTSFYIPMRDGVKLAADLYRPTKNGVSASEKLPVIWSHTPYNRRGRTTPMEALIKHGYNVAVVDFRGVYASYGSNKGYNRGEWIDPAKNDAYDVTEWFARQPWSNGNIGMWGCSAVGGSQMQAATTRPPSLKAVIPQSAEFDPYPVWVLGGMASKANVGTPTAEGGTNQVAQRDRSAVAVDGPAGADELAKAIASHAGNFDSPGQLPYRDSVSSTVGVPWWMVTNPSAHLEALKRPGMGVMVTANWDEAGTRHGAFSTVRNLTPGYVKMIVGPGAHCGWNVALREAGMDIDIEQLRFFDYWLKGVKNGVMEEDPVTYFTYNAPEGRAWQTARTWPPSSRQTDYFLTARALRTDKPSQSGTLAAPMVAPVRISSISVTTGAGSVSYETAPLAVGHGSDRRPGGLAVDLHRGHRHGRHRQARRCRTGRHGKELPDARRPARLGPQARQRSLRQPRPALASLPPGGRRAAQGGRDGRDEVRAAAHVIRVQGGASDPPDAVVLRSCQWRVANRDSARRRRNASQITLPRGEVDPFSSQIQECT